VASGDREIVRNAFQAFVQLGVDPTGDAVQEISERWWHPDVMYEEDPRWPGSGRYRGRDAAREVFDAYRDVIGGRFVAVEQVLGDDAIVAIVRAEGTSTAGVPWDHVWAYLCRVADGQVIYMRAYWDPEEALADAGVDSSP
jgi:ketosteroid isomerase-like protein